LRRLLRPDGWAPGCTPSARYVWVDGMHFNVRLEDDRLCTLVMIGARPDGTKELIAVEDGYRESALNS
jgi:transposase-like protein